ncbi:MAG: GIY-YIG nuclease family protein [Prevotellaceae bacterium]|jgi:hypothetical protein|nr:GIY-YIG nuclease family protein [Prevotellaceae bacterium]
MKPQTIQIFLPDGNPTGIKVAELTNRIITAILMPRNKIQEAEKREEIKKHGIYFLFGEIEDKAKPLVYIGETDDCLERIKTHNRNKDFWNYAVMITSKTNSFTKSHVKYLEYLSIKSAIDTSRYDTDNQVTPTKPFVTESMEADLLDNYDTLKVLLATLGFPIFEEVRISSKKSKNLFYCKTRDIMAEGNLIDDGFVVYKNSKAVPNATNGCMKWVIELREKLKENGILKEEKGILSFLSDYIFNSPSAASSAVLGRHSNGWTEWKNKVNNKTLDELYRKS